MAGRGTDSNASPAGSGRVLHVLYVCKTEPWLWSCSVTAEPETCISLPLSLPSLVGEAGGKQAHAVHSPVCLDHLKAFPWLLLKAQEFTQGRPLTMYGPEASLMLLQEQLYAF